jgi:hypothetical protein
MGGGGARMGGMGGGGVRMGGPAMGGMSAGRSFGSVGPRSFGAAPRSFGTAPRSYGMSLPRTFGSAPRSYGAMPRSYSAAPPSYGAMPRSYAAAPRSYAVRPMGPSGGAARPSFANPSAGRVTPMRPGAGAQAAAPRQFTPRGGTVAGPQVRPNAGRVSGLPGRQIAAAPQGTGPTRGVVPRTPTMRNPAPGLGPGTPNSMVVRPGRGGPTALPARIRPAPQGLTTWVRDNNRVGGTVARPGANTLGTAIPRGARTLDFGRLARTNPAAAGIRNRFGDPTNRFAVNPWHNSGGWRGHNGNWHGEHNGFHEDHDVDFIFSFGFFYPFYFGSPFWWGFGYPGYYPSIYSYWGWTPGWVLPSQVYYSAPTQVYISGNPYTYYGTYRDTAGAQQAINDIRTAWLTGNADLIAAHLSDQLDIRVAFSGKYAYTTASKDYYGMTLDAIATSRTVSVDFGQPVWLSDSDVLYTGKQVFYDPDNNQHTVYLSYRLAHVDANWYIVGVGSSLQPVSADTAGY